MKWTAALIVTGAALAFGSPLQAQTQAEPPIAARPPTFRFYDVDRRERWFVRTLNAAAGTQALNHRQADAALGDLDDIRHDQAARRARHGGRLTRADLRHINRRLNALADRLGWR